MFCRLAFTVTLFRASKVNNQFNTISLAERFNPIRKVTANSKHLKYGSFIYSFYGRKLRRLHVDFPTRFDLNGMYNAFKCGPFFQFISREISQAMSSLVFST